MPSVAVVGASQNPHKYGNRAVRAYLRRGWTVFPVNPTETTIEGLPVFRSVADIPSAVDRATVYVPPEIGLSLLPDFQRKGIAEIFLNPGSESEELVAEAERLGLNTIQACSIVDIGERP
ncbi:MAG TPA: CoA-binding protein [Polyangia bacterium]